MRLEPSSQISIARRCARRSTAGYGTHAGCASNEPTYIEGEGNERTKYTTPRTAFFADFSSGSRCARSNIFGGGVTVLASWALVILAGLFIFNLAFLFLPRDIRAVIVERFSK